MIETQLTINNKRSINSLNGVGIGYSLVFPYLPLITLASHLQADDMTQKHTQGYPTV